MNSSPSAAPPLAAAAFRFRPLHTLRFALIVASGFVLLNFALSAAEPAWQTPAGWGRAIAVCLIYALSISFTIEGLYWATRRLLGTRAQALSRWPLRLFHWGTPVIGLAIALPFSAWVTDSAYFIRSGQGLQTTPLGALAFMFLIFSLFFGFFVIRARQLRAERAAAEAQLRLLQAQMEPHFLFNTLANVVSLMEADTLRAKAMLESFTDYLRASLVSLRAPEHALGAELDLIEAYLRVVAVRMEDRLHYRIEVPDALRLQRVPALSLQPLVENAVVHGLEPSIAGGTVVVSARSEGGRLVISVSDDGIGLDAASRAQKRGAGSALANIRARLRQCGDERAALTIARCSPHGVTATLNLPASTS